VSACSERGRSSRNGTTDGFWECSDLIHSCKAAAVRRAATGLRNSHIRVSDGEARADRRRSELIDGVGAPVGKLLVVEAIEDMRVPYSGHLADHRAWIEFTAIDAHRAAEAAADLERGFDDGVTSKKRRNRLEIGDFPGQIWT